MHVVPNQVDLLPRKPSATQYQTQGRGRPATDPMTLNPDCRSKDLQSQLFQPLPPG